jgi:ABC-type nitrate/sulfonate/bicarbonate transport system substrate-binding protein
MPVPWNIRMKQKGFNELAFAGEYMKEPLTGFSASNEKLEKNPQQVKKILRGFLRSMRAFRQDSKDATDFIARRFRLEPAVATESYRIVIQSLSEDGTVSESVMQEFVDNVKKEPGVKKQLAIYDLVDFRFIREAAREIASKG